MSNAFLRFSAVLSALLLVTLAFAQKAYLQISSFPSLSVADGRSPVTITVEVRDLNGSLVRDGTPVVFETDKGTFRSKNVFETQNGFARAILTAPGVPGTAKVRASVFSLNASSTIEIDFVNDRSILDMAKEYVEVATNGNLIYANQDRILEGTGKNKGVVLKYRDITIKAEDLQLKASLNEVRARGAQITIGKRTETYRELYMKLGQRKGLGLKSEPRTTYVVHRVGFGATVEPRETADIIVCDISHSESKPHVGDVNLGQLSFTDISNSLSTVEAKRAVVNIGRGVQFQKASVRVGGQTVMTMPLFQVDLNTSSPIITEQFVDVSNSSLAVNYPYYLSLGPGQTSALRFRYGNRYASGLGATGGTYLDYEYNWNKGPRMDGGLTLSGLARDDWGANVRQFWQPDSQTSVTAQLDVPAHRSLFTNIGISRRFDGWQANLSAQHGRSLSGSRFQNDELHLNLDTDPIALGKSPLSLTFGLTAQQRRISGLGSSSQQGAGLQTRLDSRSIFLDSRDAINFSYTMTRWAGTDLSSPMTQVGSINLTSNWIPGLYLQTSYEYGQDGFTEEVLGRHRLTMDGIYSAGALNLRGYVSKGLDLDRLTANMNVDYKLGKLWRLSTGYLLDRYSGETFLEQNIVLGYRLGFREIGLSYSTRTKRLGLELLGTRFD